MGHHFLNTAKHCHYLTYYASSEYTSAVNGEEECDEVCEERKQVWDTIKKNLETGLKAKLCANSGKRELLPKQKEETYSDKKEYNVRYLSVNCY